MGCQGAKAPGRSKVGTREYLLRYQTLAGLPCDIHQPLWLPAVGPRHRSRRKGDALFNRNFGEILQALYRARAGGKGMTDITFDAIAEQHGVKKPLVRKVYDRHKTSVLSIKRGSRPNVANYVLSYWEWNR